VLLLPLLSRPGESPRRLLSCLLESREGQKRKERKKKTRKKVKGTLSAALSVVERTQKERGHRNFRLTQREKKGSRV
jgi:hypothetical protein